MTRISEKSRLSGPNGSDAPADSKNAQSTADLVGTGRWSQREIFDTGTVKPAVTVERLVEDMELELLELFPKHGELRSLRCD
jgi:hypothetical protein